MNGGGKLTLSTGFKQIYLKNYNLEFLYVSFLFIVENAGLNEVSPQFHLNIL